MKRGAVIVDRIAVLAVGGVLTGGAVAVMLWSRDSIGGGLPLRVAEPIADVQSPWWPWVTGVAGVVFVVLGLWWLSVHRRTPRAHRVRLDDESPGLGSLSADVGSAASAAAEVLAHHPALLKASARATYVKRTPTVTLVAVIAARRTLASAVGAADEVAATLARMLGDGVAVRTRIHVDARERSVPVE